MRTSTIEKGADCFFLKRDLLIKKKNMKALEKKKKVNEKEDLKRKHRRLFMIDFNN